MSPASRPNDSSLYRLWALERLGHQVIPFNAYEYESTQANWSARSCIASRQAQPSIASTATSCKSQRDEKPVSCGPTSSSRMRPKTLDCIREMGIASVSYMIDNPFGPRRDPGWRLYMKDISHYDLHVVDNATKTIAENTATVEHATSSKSKPPTNPPSTSRRPPAGQMQTETADVSFIGTPYDNRAQFLTRLWKEFNLPVSR